MKVLGICCGRKNGNTEILMKEAFKAIEAKCGAECNFVRLQEAEIRSCVGCETCMVNHLKGNWDFRCVHKPDSDHFYFIEQLMREADAIIVSAPAYNLLPPGTLIRFMNKLHASGNYRDVVHKNHKIGATFTLGGTDWTNYTLTAANMLTMELVGSYDAVVDKCHFDFVPGVGAIVLEDEMLARIRKLGENVADALMEKASGEKPSYRGAEGLCPDCHSSFLEKRADGWYCPQCLTKATLTWENGELQVSFTPEEQAKNRWSPAGQEVHDNNIRRGHGKAAQGKDIIAAKRKEYAAYKDAVKLPDLVKE